MHFDSDKDSQVRSRHKANGYKHDLNVLVILH
jgi:hypothetical protein